MGRLTASTWACSAAIFVTVACVYGNFEKADHSSTDGNSGSSSGSGASGNSARGGNASSTGSQAGALARGGVAATAEAGATSSGGSLGAGGSVDASSAASGAGDEFVAAGAGGVVGVESSGGTSATAGGATGGGASAGNKSAGSTGGTAVASGGAMTGAGGAQSGSGGTGSGGTTCGNGILDSGETCDPLSATKCVTNCTDTDVCTKDEILGSAQLCNVSCRHTTITACVAGDGCCPAACNANSDSDCQPKCGNGVKEKTELCDGSCPTNCDDGSDCTDDTLSGNASTCDASCSHTLKSCACTVANGCLSVNVTATSSSNNAPTGAAANVADGDDGTAYSISATGGPQSSSAVIVATYTFKSSTALASIVLLASGGGGGGSGPDGGAFGGGRTISVTINFSNSATPSQTVFTDHGTGQINPTIEGPWAGVGSVVVQVSGSAFGQGNGCGVALVETRFVGTGDWGYAH